METIRASIAIDTNVLAYGECVGVDRGHPKQILALQVLARFEHLIVPSQVLFELAHLLNRKTGRSRTEANATVLNYSKLFTLAPTTASVTIKALNLSTRHHLQIFDAVIIAATADAGCRYLLSEDLQSGSTISGVTIINPFVRDNVSVVAELLI